MRREKGEREIWETDWNVGAEAPTAPSRLKRGLQKEKGWKLFGGAGVLKRETNKELWP
jgi:hypothetical protein